MIKKYLRNCKRLFPVYGKRERQFIKRLRDRIQEHIDSSPNLTYEELLEQFGSPKDIVIEYYNTVDDDYLLRKTNLVKYLKIVLFSALAIVIIYFGTHFVLLYKSYQDVQDSIIIHEETIIRELPAE